MSRLLVVDWDFFFPMPHDGEDVMLYDWGHAESKMYIESLWEIRAMGFLSNGLELPCLSGEEYLFWNRMEIDEDAIIMYGESNVWAASGEVKHAGWDLIDDVWLFDQHHDCGYSKSYDQFLDDQIMSCEDWMYSYCMDGADLHVRYPRWMATNDGEIPWFAGEPRIDDVDVQIDHGGSYGPFDVVYVCRSGAWVPSWLDPEFFAFIDRAGRDSEAIAEDQYEMKIRPFDLDSVKTMIEQRKELEQRVRDLAD